VDTQIITNLRIAINWLSTARILIYLHEDRGLYRAFAHIAGRKGSLIAVGPWHSSDLKARKALLRVTAALVHCRFSKPSKISAAFHKMEKVVLDAIELLIFGNEIEIDGIPASQAMTRMGGGLVMNVVIKWMHEVI
jgi:hypothetical protein